MGMDLSRGRYWGRCGMSNNYSSVLLLVQGTVEKHQCTQDWQISENRSHTRPEQLFIQFCLFKGVRSCFYGFNLFDNDDFFVSRLNYSKMIGS